MSAFVSAPPLQSLGLDPAATIALLEGAARTSADLLRSGFGAAGVASQLGRDIKLNEDKASETLILGYLARNTSLPVLTEESGWIGTAPESGPYITVDPLDGSFNYRQGAPLCAVAIGLCVGMQPVAGCIYDFIRDESFAGGGGMPLTLNGAALPPLPPRRDVFSTGFPVAGDQTAAGVQAIVARLADWKKIRMVGAAALSLAWVASGRFDGYGEQGIRWWDVAAGLALVEAAGGRFTVEGDGPTSTLTVLAERSAKI